MALPRSQDALKTTAEKQNLETEKTRLLLPLLQQKAALTLEKLKVEAERVDERLKKLTADRAQMTIKAPASGVVYYGRCNRGRWSSSETAGEKFRRGAKLSNDEVVMTIVHLRPLLVRTTLSERQLPHVSPGMKATVVPTAYPDARLPALVERVAAVPSAGKEFDTTLNVSLDDEAAAVVPGMSCDAKIVVYQKADALTVPYDALGSDETLPDKHFVMLLGKNGKPRSTRSFSAAAAPSRSRSSRAWPKATRSWPNIRTPTDGADRPLDAGRLGRLNVHARIVESQADDGTGRFSFPSPRVATRGLRRCRPAGCRCRLVRHAASKPAHEPMLEPHPRPKPVPPPPAGAIDAAIRRGVECLVRRQNKNGSWGSAHRTKESDIYAPAPGAYDAFRTGVTAACACRP